MVVVGGSQQSSSLNPTTVMVVLLLGLWLLLGCDKNFFISYYFGSLPDECEALMLRLPFGTVRYTSCLKSRTFSVLLDLAERGVPAFKSKVVLNSKGQ